MRPSNSVALKAVSAATGQSSVATDANFQLCASVQAEITGGTAPTGTLKLQCSNDIVTSPGVPTNWSDVPNTSVAVSDNGTYLIPKTDLGYHWIRVVWVATSGTGTITANLHCFGF